VHSEPFEDVLEVGPDGPGGDDEPLGDLAIREALTQKAQHLQLTIGEPRRTSPAVPPLTDGSEVRAARRVMAMTLASL